MGRNLRLEGTETDITNYAVRHTPPDTVAESNPRGRVTFDRDGARHSCCGLN